MSKGLLVLVTLAVAAVAEAKPPAGGGLPTELGILRLGTPYSRVSELLPLETGPGGTCREMLVSTDDVRRTMPLDLQDGLVMLLFDNYAPDAPLSYMHAPAPSAVVTRMIEYYTSLFGVPVQSWKQTLLWSDEYVTVELAIESATSSRPDRGYIAIYRKDFDFECASDH